MPRQKDLKRLVRARMRKTGEAYTTARSHVIKRKPVKKHATPAATYADLAGMSDAAVAAKTGCTWKQWVGTLDGHGAAALSHREIATLIRRTWNLGSWWSQMVAVGYERIKGLRERGQLRSGRFNVSKSKTFNVSVSRLFEALTDPAVLGRWLPDARAIRTAIPNRSARITMRDGAIAAFGFTAKGHAKSVLAVGQENLPDRAARDACKTYWSERFAALERLVP